RTESLKIIQQLRNEAHRFGITFHRQKRSKQAIETELERIKGIGQKTALNLLKEFRSVKRIKSADESQLSKIVGQAKAKIIKDYFSKK
ncbi:MAG: excinuclease ABC subunit C, partial [Psychroflexus sp.]|nr:excinuclease ABC subunit C [Psychroflexus sp.]